MPGFNLNVPKYCPGIDETVLMPSNTWGDDEAYNEQLKKLAQQFIENFENYTEGVPAEVIQKGGPNVNF